MPQFIATIPPGFEYLLVEELQSLGVEDPKEGLMQVIFDTDWSTLYRVCLWSRLANRILYPLSKFDAPDEHELYKQVFDIDWDLHLSADSTLAVDFVSRKSKLNHERYGAQKIKDAVVDYFRDNYGERPSVDTAEPDVRLHCRINKDVATLCIDLSGKSLHQRGYREKTGSAPIKESLAAAILMRAGWGSENENAQWLLDPMCGAGTIAIEAALMAYDIAPGLLRRYWGFLGWKPFHAALWEEQTAEALERKSAAESDPSKPKIFASDSDPWVIGVARTNAQNAGVADCIEFERQTFEQLKKSDLIDQGMSGQGVVVTNPPYGERLGEQESIKQLYRVLGDWLKREMKGDSAAVLATQKDHGHALNIRADKLYKFFNGPIECELLKLRILESQFITPREHLTGRAFIESLPESARMLANRIEKNRSSLKSFLKQQNHQCYRVYDADLPEYAAAIDVYQDRLHIQEYAPPKSIDERKAQRRLRDIVKVAAAVLEIDQDNVFVKTRSRQKGANQYLKTDANQNEKQLGLLTVQEGTAKIEVNLSDYLDTGLFLDHRKTRQLIPKWSAGGTFLNLFCYTATASLHAALTGTSTVNVDMSNTYLNWGKRNFKLNHIDLDQHRFVRENCVEWLTEAHQEYSEYFDVIFIDPPTFSNSKRMEQHFDVQKDHVELLNKALLLLKPGGKLIFSNNFRKFSMDFVAKANDSLREITRETTSRDFARRPLHRCWTIDKSDR